MLIELSLLPPEIVQHILHLQSGATVQLSHQGQIVADIVPTQSSYEMLMAMETPDGIDEIDEEPLIRQPSSRMTV